MLELAHTGSWISTIKYSEILWSHCLGQPSLKTKFCKLSHTNDISDIKEKGINTQKRPLPNLLLHCFHSYFASIYCMAKRHWMLWLLYLFLTFCSVIKWIPLVPWNWPWNWQWNYPWWEHLHQEIGQHFGGMAGEPVVELLPTLTAPHFPHCFIILTDPGLWILLNPASWSVSLMPQPTVTPHTGLPLPLASTSLGEKFKEIQQTLHGYKLFLLPSSK